MAETNGQALAKRWNDWRSSQEGTRCCDFSTIGNGQYLENRLWRAFMAGAAAPSLPSCQLIYGDKETWCGRYTRNGEANSGMNLAAWYSAAVFWRNKAEGIPNPGELCPKCGWGMLIRQDGETICHGGGCVAALSSDKVSKEDERG